MNNLIQGVNLESPSSVMVKLSEVIANLEILSEQKKKLESRLTKFLIDMKWEMYTDPVSKIEVRLNLNKTRVILITPESRKQLTKRMR